MENTQQKQKFETICIHGTSAPEQTHGSINTPIFLSSTFAKKTADTPFGNYDYTRGGNPTTDSLNTLISNLEGGKYTWTVPSGCAAISTLLSFLKKGDHIIGTKGVYGGMERIASTIYGGNYEIESDYVDMTEAEEVKKWIKDSTKIVWLESPTNPLQGILDIKAVCDAIKGVNQDILIVIDNTLATPYNTKPLELGVDVVMHSLSKFMSGHCDIIGGSLTTNDEEIFKKIKKASTSNFPFNLILILFLRFGHQHQSF